MFNKTRIIPYKETHQTGIIYIENKVLDFKSGVIYDFGIQIASDGRVWICIDDIAYIRFKPSNNPYGEKR